MQLPHACLQRKLPGWWCSIMVCAVSVLSIACDSSKAKSDSTSANPTDSAGVKIVNLPAMPGIFVGTKLADIGVVAKQDLSEQFEFAYANDVAIDTNDDVIALDRVRAELVRVGATRTLVARKGKGPGELSRPIALELLDSVAVVLEPMPVRTLTTIALRSKTALPRSLDLDGSFNSERPVTQVVLFSPSVGEGMEDPARRMRRVSDSTFALEVRTRQPLQERGTLLLLNRQLVTLDTLATFAVASTSLPAKVPASDSLHAERSLWAVSNGWHAIFERGTSSIDVYRGKQKTLSVRWKASAVPLTHDDQITTVKWFGEYTTRMDAAARQMMESMSKSDIQQQYEQFAKMQPFADRQPAVTAMFGADKCLFVAGWNAADSRDGVSRRWHVLNVETGTYIGGMQAAFPDTRLRDSRGGKLFATHLDSTSQSVMDVYSLPAQCVTTLR